jgi:DNA polymerase-3 subunit gamma/tau
MDVIEIDGASNRGVDEIRNLRESVRYTPTRGKKKVYIIDEVHMLTKEAFNALLKTLEEPPAHVLFIFATTELHKVPATILSRCQRYDFRRISVEEIVGRLKYIAGEEKITIDNDALLIIAKKGDGSMRDAQSIFDQVISFCGTTVDAKLVADALNIVDLDLFFTVSDVFRAKDAAAGLQLVEEVINSGFDAKEFVSGIAEHFRNMLIVKTTASTHLIEESEQHRKRYAADVQSFSVHDLLRIIKVVTDTENTIRYSVQPRFKLEMMIVQLTTMESSVRIDDLLEGIDALKKKLHAEGSTVTPAPRSPAPEPRIPAAFKIPSSVEEAKTKYTFTAGHSAAQDETAAIASPTHTESLVPSVGFSGDVPLELIAKEWSAIVEVLRKKKISVGTIMGETHPVEIVNGALRIGCGDEFHRSTILRNKELISETIAATVQAKIRIEPFIAADHTPAPSKPQTPQGSAPVPDTAVAHNENHPLIKTLYSDFGAERIN